MNEEKKYLFLAITEGFAGAEHFLVDYFKFIDYNNYSVTLGVKKDVFSPSLQANNLPVEVISLPLVNEWESFLSKLLHYYKFFLRIKPHCIVFNQYWLRSFTLPEIIAAYVATGGNTYMIVHDCPPVFPSRPSRLHFGFVPDFGLPWRMRRLFQTLLGYCVKSTIAVSKAARDTLVGLHHFPSKKVNVVYHGVDVVTYCPSRENRMKLRRELNIPDGEIVIISTAMLWPVKRVERLVRAFASLGRARDGLHLIIAGTGSEYETLVELAKSFGKVIEKRIHFLGYRDDIPNLLQSSDIYVLPSDSEGLPLACLEAMSCGLISVATDSGGTSEITRNGYNGYLVERSEEGVLHGLEMALSLDKERRGVMSRNAATFVKEQFSIDTNVRSGLTALRLIGEQSTSGDTLTTRGNA